MHIAPNSNACTSMKVKNDDGYFFRRLQNLRLIRMNITAWRELRQRPRVTSLPDSCWSRCAALTAKNLTSSQNNFDKAALLQQTDGSIVFARWRQCPSHEGTLPPPGEHDWTCASFGHQSPQPKRQIDRFSRFCTAHGRKSLYFTMGAPFPKISCWISTPSNLWFLGPVRAHNPNHVLHRLLPRPKTLVTTFVNVYTHSLIGPYYLQMSMLLSNKTLFIECYFETSVNCYVLLLFCLHSVTLHLLYFRTIIYFSN